MTDTALEEAVRASGTRLGARSLPPGLRARLLAETGRRAGLRTARFMVLVLVLANAVIAAIVVLSGAGRSAQTAPQPASGSAAAPAVAEPARPDPGSSPLDAALIAGRRGVADAWLEEASACRLATSVLPPDPRACRSAAALVAQAASDFARRLRALPPTDATAPGVADLLVTLGDLQRSAQALDADVDRQAVAAAVADDTALGTAAWSADMALVYGPG